MGFFDEFRPWVHIPLIIGGIILFVGLAFLFGFVVMWLWNWLMPDIFGLPEITYWQAWGLLVLSHILFKSGSGSSSSSSCDDSGSKKKRKKKGGFAAEFKEEFKKEFKKGWKDECCKDDENWENWDSKDVEDWESAKAELKAEFKKEFEKEDEKDESDIIADEIENSTEPDEKDGTK